PRLLASRQSIRLVVARMEALEIDAVVDDGHALGRDVVEALDVVLAGSCDGHDLARALEHLPFEREDDPMVPAAPSARHPRGEIRPMTSFTRPVDVLRDRALVALHDVP